MTQTSLRGREVLWVAAVLLLALAPHMARFPLILDCGFVAACLWRYLGAQGHLPLPDREHRLLWLLKQLVAIAAFVTIYIAFRGKLGRDAGVELLAALLGLKLLEMRSPRDYYVVTLLCYFLVVTNFFYSQTIPTALYMLGVVIGATTVLVQYNTPPALRAPRAMFKLSATMTAQAMPLMLLAFVLFPRLPGPLWGLPQDAFDSVTGLSDTMTVGEITRLGMSNEIAFRVQFHGPEPRARARYWRGPVLWHSDGRTWQTANFADGPAPVEHTGPRYFYTVTIEPHRKRWLLGLDVVTGKEAALIQTADYALKSPQAVRKRLRYELDSAIEYRMLGLSDAERAAALELPRGYHPRARALAEQWRAQAKDADDIIARALDFYRSSKFVYSLTPPTLPGDTVDDFLFTTREGFCEHFASSFVILMRAAGIPARVVTGYQGGEYNEVGDYMVIRQRDAHAWAEVYLDGRGWVRVDPTATVAPARVSLGFADANPRGAPATGFARDGLSGQVWTRLRDSFDAITNGWNQWVLGYTAQQQRSLFEELGFENIDYGSLVIALTVALVLMTGALAVLLWRAARPLRDPVSAAYGAFCAKLARIGYTRGASEAPLAYAERVSRLRGDLAAEVRAITRLYGQLRYGRGASDAKRLHRQVARFRPRRR
jgi:transglutaminase-like putative cysteine protease